jgi:hypothetical protein
MQYIAGDSPSCPRQPPIERKELFLPVLLNILISFLYLIMDDEYVRFIYDKVYDEINRCRDWPIKILGFTSGLFVAILGFLKLFPGKVGLTCNEKWSICIIMSFFSIFCVYILGKQHLAYLRYRNIQIRLQNHIGIQNWLGPGDKRIIPREWDDELNSSLRTNSQGWLFYACYILLLSAFSIYIVAEKL